MKIKKDALLAAVMALCLLCGCGQKQAEEVPQETKPGTAAAEQKVTAYADIDIRDYGTVTVALCGEAAPETVENLGAVKEPNVEKLLAAEPDFVLGSTKTAADVELMGLLEQSSIPVAYFDISSFEDYLRMLEVCTWLTGCPERYTQYGTEVQVQVEQAAARQDGSAPRVLYVRATGSSCKVKNSQGTVLGEMLAALGCVNIADSETGLLETLSMETILAEDPEHIFVVLQGSDTTRAEQTLEMSLLSNPAWNELTAVREGRYHVMDQRLYNVKPNARWGEAYEKLADILYPEQ